MRTIYVGNLPGDVRRSEVSDDAAFPAAVYIDQLLPPQRLRI